MIEDLQINKKAHNELKAPRLCTNHNGNLGI